MDYVSFILSFFCLLAVGPMIVLGLLSHRSLSAKIAQLELINDQQNQRATKLQLEIGQLHLKTPLEERLVAAEQKIAALQLRR